jgi:hypothetical protein
VVPEVPLASETSSLIASMIGNPRPRVVGSSDGVRQKPKSATQTTIRPLSSAAPTWITPVSMSR